METEHESDVTALECVRTDFDESAQVQVEDSNFKPHLLRILKVS
ncbi:MAG: hypothetical protein ACI9UN_002183 [Granulosicoccus sp.]|jgi:hypothetical protein